MCIEQEFLCRASGTRFWVLLVPTASLRFASGLPSCRAAGAWGIYEETFLPFLVIS